MSYAIQNNIIVLPIDISAIAFIVSEDKKSITPITSESKDTAEEVLNKTRKQTFRVMQSLESEIEYSRKMSKLADVLKDIVGDNSKIRVISDISGAQEKGAEFERKALRQIEVFQEFLENSLELMMDFNITVEQLDTGDKVDTQAAEQGVNDLIAKLQNKQ